MSPSEPFADVVRAELRERDWSQAELARRSQKLGWPPSKKTEDGAKASLSSLLNGDYVPSPRAMETIAQALGIEPTRFAEYAPQLMRERLDLHKHSLEEVLAALDEAQSR